MSIWPYPSKLSVSLMASIYNMLLLVNSVKRLMPISSLLYLTVLTHHQTGCSIQPPSANISLTERRCSFDQ
eukprot:13259598-Ditylum_brightwellii.AAC.1